MKNLSFTRYFGAVAALFLLAGVAAPRANGALVTYYNFEDSDLTSDTGTANPPPLQTTMITKSAAGTSSFVTGTGINLAPGDTVTTNKALQMAASGNANSSFQFSVTSTGLANLSLSFATALTGNFDNEIVAVSINGGAFTTILNIPSSSAPTFTQESISNIAGTGNQASVTFRFTFTGNGSVSGTGTLDNIQVNTVPEPATVTSGVLALLALCWHQRRRFFKRRELLSFQV